MLKVNEPQVFSRRFLLYPGCGKVDAMFDPSWGPFSLANLQLEAQFSPPTIIGYSQPSIFVISHDFSSVSIICPYNQSISSMWIAIFLRRCEVQDKQKALQCHRKPVQLMLRTMNSFGKSYRSNQALE